MDFNTRSCSFPIVSSSFQVNRYKVAFSPGTIIVSRIDVILLFQRSRKVFNSTLPRRGYSNMRSRSSSNFWSIPPRCYRIMTCLEFIKWYAKFFNEHVDASLRIICPGRKIHTCKVLKYFISTDIWRFV